MPAMRLSQKIAVGVGITVVAYIAALAALPLVFGDRITEALKTQINGSIDARVAWRDLSFSLVREFPHASLTATELSVAGVRAFEHDTLFATHQMRFALDVGSVIGYLRRGQPIVVIHLSFDQPAIRLRRLADGTANWNITKPAPPSSSAPPRAVSIVLHRFRITRGVVTVDDRQAGIALAMHGIDESLSGDFNKDLLVISTRTHADSVSATFAGIPYLNRVSLDLAANVDADLRAHRFTLANDTLRLNRLLLALSGTVTSGPDLALDVKFSAPNTAFASILSLVPAIYTHDFDKLRTSGTLALQGQVRGAYGPKTFPALAIRARVDDGTFRYPDLPLGVTDVGLELAVDNPGGHVDSTVVDLKRFHAMLGTRPVDASLLVRTPVSDPDATVRLNAAIDLADVARTLKLENVSGMSGLVAADLSTHARVSDVDARRYDRVTASGTVAASRVTLRASTLPQPVAVDTASLEFTPQNARLTALSAKIGTSDAHATGSLDNLLGFVLRDQDLRGRATVTSDHFNVNEWKSKEKSTEVVLVPPHVDFDLDATAREVKYGPLTIANVKGNLLVKDQRVTMRNLTMEMAHGSVVANGFYETLKPDNPVFNMSVGLTTLDIPTAVASLATIQQLAPIAKYAQGHVSGTLSLTGPLARDMSPVLTALAGKGEITTYGLVLKGAPVMQKLSSSLSLAQLASPTIGAVHAAIDFADGRMHVQPFHVNVSGLDLTTSGSNGIDQSLAYDLALAVPRASLGTAATTAITKLASKAGQLGSQLPAGDVVQLQAKVTGTMTNPNVATNFAGMAGSVTEATQAAVKQMASTATASAKQKVDSSAAAASAKARAEADRAVAEAERQADSIRAAGRALANKLRSDADAQIDSLVAKATNPIAKLAAQKAADKLRDQTKQQADRVTQEANARADSVVGLAKQKTAVVPKPTP
jgi:hypothetical protein